MVEDSERPLRTQLARVLRAARDAALAAGVAGSLDGTARTTALAAIGGALVGGGAVARREFLETPAERVDEADAAIDRAASLIVPSLQNRVVALEATSEQLAEQFLATAEGLADEILHARQARSRRRLVDVGKTLLALVAQGHAEPADFDTDEAQESIGDAVKFALDALSPEAVPAISRLMTRRVDHFFRATCRTIVDLDGGELGDLREVIAAVARALPAYMTPEPVPNDPKLAGTAHAYNDWRARTRELSLWKVERWVDGGYMVADRVLWRPTEATASVALDRDTPIVALLLSHRLADPPAPEATKVDSAGRPLPRDDDRLLTMRIRTLVDLHFVLSAERIEIPPPR